MNGCVCRQAGGKRARKRFLALHITPLNVPLDEDTMFVSGPLYGALHSGVGLTKLTRPQLKPAHKCGLTTCTSAPSLVFYVSFVLNDFSSKS